MTRAPNWTTADLSSCPGLVAPQDLNPCNAGRLTPPGFTVYEPEKPHA